MPMTLLRQARNPHEICLAVSMVVVALLGIVFGPLSETIRDELTLTQQISWSALVMIGALLSLSGSYWSTPTEGVKIERAGQVMLFFGTSAYSGLLWNESGFERSGIVIIITFGIAIGAFLRSIQITRGLRKVRRLVIV
jgi:hypothetical protein